MKKENWQEGIASVRLYIRKLYRLPDLVSTKENIGVYQGLYATVEENTGKGLGSTIDGQKRNMTCK